MAERPLPSWRDGPARAAILEFVTRVTSLRGPDYLRPSERTAVFDNDGTLWCEQPLPVQALFLIDRVHQLAAASPDLATRQPFKAFLEHDTATLHKLGKRGIADVMFATHAGMSEEQFDRIARAWLATAEHPRFRRLFTKLAYQPQLELLGYLREHGFKTYVVSGGGVDFIRAFAEQIYGTPPEQVIGSSAKLQLDIHGNEISLLKLPELQSFDDRETKVQNIGLHIGRRPVFAFGNSDGDLAMLRYTHAGPPPRLALLLHHDDAEREYAYDRDFKVSPLAEGLDQAAAYGIQLVSMKNDWETVFADEVAARPPRSQPARVAAPVRRELN